MCLGWIGVAKMKTKHTAKKKKKMKFSIKDLFSKCDDVTKSTVSCGFGHIY